MAGCRFWVIRDPVEPAASPVMSAMPLLTGHEGTYQIDANDPKPTSRCFQYKDEIWTRISAGSRRDLFAGEVGCSATALRSGYDMKSIPPGRATCRARF
jgi:hypothetical protein